MKNITIGLAGPNWKLAATARYYAERGDGEEYAFGTTPIEALAKLEKREATVNSKFDQDLAEEVAFLALGAADFLKDHRGTDLDAHGGYVGFIGEVIRHAPMLADRWHRLDGSDFCGVWLYDVTERFGREWAEGLFSGTDENPAERLDCIIEDEMGKWQ